MCIDISAGISVSIKEELCKNRGVKRILIVEDNQELVELLSLQAKIRGYEPIVASSVAQAEKLFGSKIAFIILDLRIEGGHGFEILSKAKSHPATENIPITVFSAHDDINTVDVAYQLGANQFVGKPGALSEVFNLAP